MGENFPNVFGGLEEMPANPNDQYSASKLNPSRRVNVMKQLSDVKFSTLDLVPVRENGSPAQSLRN